MALGMLTDVVGFLLDLDVGHKMQLLSEPDARRRAEMVLERLAEVAADDALGASGKSDFPPQFRVN